MPKSAKNPVLIFGILSPFAGIFLGVLVYATLSHFSADLKKDWLFRLSLSTLAMTIPALITFVLALRQRRRGPLNRPGKVGLFIAVLSLALIVKPVSDGIVRSKQTRNQALRDVLAPSFETSDIVGTRYRLADYKGQVVLVNIWATWCAPCRKEMPRLDKLYRDKKSQGFVVFGISDEGIDVQKKFLSEVPVSYPLLTLNGTVPPFYRDIAQYPALFLIDRQGRLQPAPTSDQPFENVEAAVSTVLSGK